MFSYLLQSSTEYKERRKREAEAAEKHEQTCLLSLSQSVSKLCSDPGAFINLCTCEKTQMLQVVVIQEGVLLINVSH